MSNLVLPAVLGIQFPSSGIYNGLGNKAEPPVASIDVRQSVGALPGPINPNEDAENARSGL